MNNESAELLVDAWKKDFRVYQLPDSVIKDVSGDKFVRFKMSVKVWIASFSTLANNALWSGNFDLAKKYLIKYGVGKQRAPSKPNLSLARAFRYAPKDYKTPKAKHDWNVVK